MDTEMMDLFGFTPEDLSANQMGSLTQKQEKALAASRTMERIIFLVIGVPLLLAGLAPFVIFLAKIPTPGIQVPVPGTPNYIPMMIVIPIVSLLVIVMGANMIRTALKRVDNSVANVEGPARLVRRSVSDTNGNSTLVHELVVGSNIFRISERAFLMLKEGDIYTLYFTRGGGTLLSVVHQPTTA